MNYKLIGNNDYMVNPMIVVLNNRGITDTKSFLNVNLKNTYSHNLLKNIEKAVEMYLKHIKNCNHILIIIDSDVDGYVSASLIYNYTKRINKNIKISFHIHDKKIHGVFNDDVPEGVDLVIVPDAGRLKTA